MTEPICFTDALIDTILRNVRYVEDLSIIKPFTDTLTSTIVDLAKKARAEREMEMGDGK